jgi:hypothetical protein
MFSALSTRHSALNPPLGIRVFKNVIILPVVSICILTLLFFSPVSAQEPDTLARSEWNHSFENDFYFYKNDFVYLPIYSVNKDRLHLEARYNYEDMKTFSAWFGYNFSGGKKLQYSITPMVGGIVGNTKGIAPGLEFDFEYHGFELYSESEYVFDLQQKENNFFYNWTDLTYSPLDWLWVGLSMQRTRLFKTDAETEGGLILGGGYRWFELTGYMYNPGGDNPYVILSLSVNLPEN